MELTFTCPACRSDVRVPDVERAALAHCGACGVVRDLKPECADEGGALLTCPWCATTDLYIQKDFPQGLGLAILCVGFGISTVFWYFQQPLATFAVLIASVALDWILYYRVPEVTICYRCLSQIRGRGSDGNGRHKPFDLAIGERYRQERLRIEELHKTGDQRDHARDTHKTQA